MVLPKPVSRKDDSMPFFLGRSSLPLVRSKLFLVGTTLVLFMWSRSSLYPSNGMYSIGAESSTTNHRTIDETTRVEKPEPAQPPTKIDTGTSDRHDLISPEELGRLIDELRGDDHRLVRWDATKHTRKKQRRGGCDELPRALDAVASEGRGVGASDGHKALACEFATFCITDNPRQRARLGQHEGIHAAVVGLVASPDVRASAMASHLIYIATFSNAKNHRAFVEHGAVGALGALVKSEASEPIQAMWAAAALQNLAASYCDTEGNGRCYWRWDKKALDRPVLVIKNSSLPMISDGSEARRQILDDPDLVRALAGHACRGPVSGTEGPGNPFPGEHAVAGRDDRSPNIVPWAAAGALKNAALSLSPGFLEALDPAMPCFCRMARSDDWLEANKAGHVLDHTRRRDPCWFGPGGEDYEAPGAELCVDRYFVDGEGYDCSGYERAGGDECATGDATGTTRASEACCPCGGGTRGGPVRPGAGG
ncbi:unnamed protein product [Pseudo-nitzschia multistriata]|uniref:Armadillo repeat-containing domain-containing protein n=1 Tax=Pseudo-nitzschia multistriata TaxID=183589 RepID=A0A448ZEJ0_9STRA|nr:unnamed protein product [Pseudo-nitzschia multistriata]